MKTPRPILSFALLACGLAPYEARPDDLRPPAPDRVRVQTSGDSITLANRHLQLIFRASSATLRSMLYQGQELLGPGKGYLQIVGGGRPQPPTRWKLRVVRSEAALAEIAFDNVAEEMPFEIASHFILRADEPGFHQYLVLGHDADRRPGIFDMEQFNACYRVDPRLFTDAAVDGKRMGPMPSTAMLKAAEIVTDATYRLADGSIYTKYFLAATMDERHRVHGLLGRGLGLWIIMPSHEHLNGGPEHQELTVHQTDTTPVLLRHFVAGHYGAGGIHSDSREGSWSKASATWFVYVNSGKDRAGLLADAQRRADEEAAQWPYSWLDDSRFQLRRGAVAGRLTFDDGKPVSGARVILAPHHDQPAPTDWQQQWHGYRFYGRTDAEGRFKLEKIRPGEYDLYAWAPGRFGRFCHDRIVSVQEGDARDLGKAVWRLPRGRTLLWRIGIPDRSAVEFAGGDAFRQFGLWNKIARAHPQGVVFTVGENFARDWPMLMAVTQQAVRSTAGNAEEGGSNLGQSPSSGSTFAVHSPAWQVRFHCAESLAGQGILTIGLSGYEGRGSREGQMRLRLNGGTIGRIDGMKGDSSIHRCGASGLYRQHEVRFDAASLRPGANILTIELPPPSRIPRQALAVPLSAVLWDCLQMEVERPDR